MNLMRSNQLDNEWPYGENSWINMYTHKPPGEPVVDGVKLEQGRGEIQPNASIGSDLFWWTWGGNGFTSTYAYDVHASGQYSIQC